MNAEKSPETTVSSQPELENKDLNSFEIGQSVVVKRSSGYVENGWNVNEIKQHDGKDWIQVVKPDENSNEFLGKWLTSEELQEMQNLQKQEVRHIPIKESENTTNDIVEHESPISVIEQDDSKLPEGDNTLDNLSESDLTNLRLYAEYLEDKKQAQQNGDGYASIEYGQRAGQSYRALSSKAQKLAPTYLAQRSRKLE